MPRTDEAEWWFNAVYDAVQQIPYAKVTSYGHIARLLGQPQRARQVGVCLKHLPTDPAQFYNNTTVPWQRVINSRGMISHRGPGGAANQATVLQTEGVVVQTDSMGELYVDLGTYGWFPQRLPNDSDGSDEEQEEEEEEGR